MKVTRHDGAEARVVLTRMVLDPQVLGPLAARWGAGDLFASKAENLLGGWAVDHYKKYRKAPGRAVATYFDRWAKTRRDEGVEDFVATFLESLSAEAARNGTADAPAYVLDVADRVFAKARQERLAEEIAAAHARGDVAAADKAIAAHRKVEVGLGSGAFLFSDLGALDAALDPAAREPLVEWDQQALNDFFGRTTAREEFLVFLGIEKMGKSMFLQETAIQAVKSGRRVAFFETGDQSDSQIRSRFAARLAAHSRDPRDRVRVPIKLDPGDGDRPAVEFRVEEFPAGLSADQARRAFTAFEKEFGADKLLLSVHANSSVTVAGLETVLDRHAADGWVPDLVVVDYADLLAPMNGEADTRDQIDMTWRALRRLNQERHCCLVTATQADAAGYGVKTLTMANFSNCKTKNAHATAIVGINQDRKEADDRLFRLQWVCARDIDTRGRPVYAASCLELCNPCMLACF